MSKSNTWETDLLKLVFNNVGTALIGDATGLLPSGTTGSLYLSLHTADPGETGDQTTSETAYTGYTRFAVARTTGGFTVANGAVQLVANADFGACTAAPGANIGYFGIGTSASGTGKLLYSGPLNPTIVMNVGVQPRITTAPNLVTED
jgi:hypothetical protein